MKKQISLLKYLKDNTYESEYLNFLNQSSKEQLKGNLNNLYEYLLVPVDNADDICLKDIISELKKLISDNHLSPLKYNNENIDFKLKTFNSYQWNIIKNLKN